MAPPGLGPAHRSDSEAAALVALLRTARRPSRPYADLVEAAGSAQTVLEQEQGLLAPELVAAAAREVGNWIAAGFELLTVLDREYPDNLRAVHDRPPLLFVAGKLTSADDRSVAVIGSRRASAAGIESARAISEALIASRYTVVSGLASGVDTTAHTTALEHGARTIAVIGTGLRRFYPPENASLQRRIAHEGAVVSQFWPDDGPSRQSFPERNAVMSGLALATVIVEAGQNSGARIQARRALAHGRPVLLARSVLAQPWGEKLAGQPGAHVIESASDVPAVIDRLASVELPTA